MLNRPTVMFGPILCVVLLSAGIARPSIAADPAALAPLHVEVVSITVAKVLSDSDQRRLDGLYKSGVTLGILVTSPEQAILNISQTDSVLSGLTDSNGSDLLATIRGRDGNVDLTNYGFDTPFSSGWDPGSSSKTVGLTLHAPGVPSAGSTSIRLKAHIAASVALHASTATSSGALLVPGALLQAGPFSLKLDEVKYDKSAKQWGYSFSSESDLRVVRSISLVTTSGTLVGVDDGESTNGNVMTGKSYSFARKVKSAKVRVDYYDQVRPEAVDVDQTISVGL